MSDPGITAAAVLGGYALLIMGNGPIAIPRRFSADRAAQ